MMSLNASRTSVRRAAAPVRAVRARAEETKTPEAPPQAPEAPITPEQPTNLTSAVTENAPSTSRGVVQEAKDTIKPRVNELRRQQLSQGTTSFESIMKFTGPVRFRVCCLLRAGLRCVSADVAAAISLASLHACAAACCLARATLIIKCRVQAPELINGRLAMFGFFAAMCAEITSKETAFQQFTDAPAAVLAFAVLITVASIVPIVRGSAVLDDGAGEGLKFGSFNVTNECASIALDISTCLNTTLLFVWVLLVSFGCTTQLLSTLPFPGSCSCCS